MRRGLATDDPRQEEGSRRSLLSNSLCSWGLAALIFVIVQASRYMAVSFVNQEFDGRIPPGFIPLSRLDESGFYISPFRRAVLNLTLWYIMAWYVVGYAIAFLLFVKEREKQES